MEDQETNALGAGGSLPPKDYVVRSVMPGVEIRSAEDGARTLHGHFSVFNQWTEINSMWEGRFMERIAPGAFAKTFQDRGDKVKVLFDHGHDPSIGNKPLGRVSSLTEDERGAAYEVELFDTSYVRDLIPALEAGQLGASFRFRVVKEDYDENAERSAYNPEGLPERTIREVSVAEFGPVTFPAYEGATAGVRSDMDAYILRRFQQKPEMLRALVEGLLPAGTEQGGAEAPAPTQERAEPEAHSPVVRRGHVPLFGLDHKEKPSWQL